MTQQGLDAARRLTGQVREVIATLTPDDWQAPSSCPGWRVQDVIAHLAAGAHSTVDPTGAPPPAPARSDAAEDTMEAMVSARRDWTPHQISAEYLTYAGPALDIMAGLQADPGGTTLVPILDLGTYPLSLLPDIVTFDHYCHLHIDVLEALNRPPLPADDSMLRPAIGWMLAGLPQMQGHDLDVLLEPLALELDGDGGGRWVLHPATAATSIIVEASGADCPATVRSNAADFIRWATKRASWRELAELSGDCAGAAEFLDRLNIV